VHIGIPQNIPSNNTVQHWWVYGNLDEFTCSSRSKILSHPTLSTHVNNSSSVYMSPSFLMKNNSYCHTFSNLHPHLSPYYRKQWILLRILFLMAGVRIINNEQVHPHSSHAHFLTKMSFYCLVTNFISLQSTFCDIGEILKFLFYLTDENEKAGVPCVLGVSDRTLFQSSLFESRKYSNSI
jgi:hypothetical protein